MLSPAKARAFFHLAAGSLAAGNAAQFWPIISTRCWWRRWSNADCGSVIRVEYVFGDLDDIEAGVFPENTLAMYAALRERDFCGARPTANPGWSADSEDVTTGRESPFSVPARLWTVGVWRPATRRWGVTGMPWMEVEYCERLWGEAAPTWVWLGSCPLHPWRTSKDRGGRVAGMRPAAVRLRTRSTYFAEGTPEQIDADVADKTRVWGTDVPNWAQRPASWRQTWQWRSLRPPSRLSGSMFSTI